MVTYDLTCVVSYYYKCYSLWTMGEKKGPRSRSSWHQTFHKLNIYVFTFFSLLSADFRVPKRLIPQPHKEFMSVMQWFQFPSESSPYSRVSPGFPRKFRSLFAPKGEKAMSMLWTYNFQSLLRWVAPIILSTAVCMVFRRRSRSSIRRFLTSKHYQKFFI